MLPTYFAAETPPNSRRMSAGAVLKRRIEKGKWYLAGLTTPRPQGTATATLQLTLMEENLGYFLLLYPTSLSASLA